MCIYLYPTATIVVNRHKNSFLCIILKCPEWSPHINIPWSLNQGYICNHLALTAWAPLTVGLAPQLTYWWLEASPRHLHCWHTENTTIVDWVMDIMDSCITVVAILWSAGSTCTLLLYSNTLSWNYLSLMDYSFNRFSSGLECSWLVELGQFHTWYVLGFWRC